MSAHYLYNEGKNDFRDHYCGISGKAAAYDVSIHMGVDVCPSS